MKKIYLPMFLFLLATTTSQILSAQCTCSQPDPFAYQSSSCGLTDASIVGDGAPGSNPVCSAGSSCDGSSTSYGYVISFSGSVTGYAWKITGGWANREIISGYVDRQTCSGGGTAGQFGTESGFSVAVLYVRWDNAATDRRIEVWGYTGVCSGPRPCSLSYFKCVPITVTSIPATPTSITVSSPNYFGTCGWKVASSYISNATQYSWSGAGYGTYSSIVGPVIPENQTAYICVMAGNTCGWSSNYCANVVIPNNTSCGSRINRNTQVEMEQQALGEIRIFPQPATTGITIYTADKEISSIELYSMTGQLVRKLIPTQNARQEVNVSALQRGIYVVVVRQKNGTIHKRNILVQ